MNESEPPPAVLLKRMINGFQVSQALYVAATLGLADLLKGGARGSDDLAAATDTHPGALYRLLRALASVGVLREEDGARFALTPLGEALRENAPEPVAGWAALIGRAPYWRAWSALLDSVRTGENAFRLAHGMGVWDYRAGDPEDAAAFQRAMTDLTRGSESALLESCDFGRFGTLVDVGGGQGAFLGTALAAHPHLRGVLFDLPHVIAPAGEALRAGDRLDLVGGSFFDFVPQGADAYLLKKVLHDWEDREVGVILHNCRRAILSGGTLLVIERVLGGAGDREGAFSDLNMLVVPGGRERTLGEYAALLEGAGFALARVMPGGAGLSALEAVPV